MGIYLEGLSCFLGRSEKRWNQSRNSRNCFSRSDLVAPADLCLSRKLFAMQADRGGRSDAEGLWWHSEDSIYLFPGLFGLANPCLESCSCGGCTSSCNLCSVISCGMNASICTTPSCQHRFAMTIRVDLPSSQPLHLRRQQHPTLQPYQLSWHTSCVP